MKEKILGGLFGQAMGDSWAMPAMLAPEQTWELHKGWITEFRDAPDTHPVHKGLVAGQVTDDTEQAFALAEAMIEDGRVSAEGMARAVVAWYDRIGGDASPYVGPSTRRAVQAIKRGEDIYRTGSLGDTNGASMRVSPVGLIHPGDVRGAIHDAYLSCIPTHHTDVAVSGAAAVAAAVAAALKPGATLDDVLQAGLMGAEEGRKFGNHWMGASVDRRIEMAIEIARKPATDRKRLQEIYDVIGSGLAITEAVPAAFGVLVMGKGHPRQTAIYAAGLSGDADTVAAMACAIAGAWSGVGVFTDAELNKMRSVNTALDFDRVAEGLYQLALKNQPKEGV